MGLAGIVFTKEPNRTFEVDGHKVVVKKLTAGDSLAMESAINAVSKGGDVEFKVMFNAFLDLLAMLILEVDGQKAENVADTRTFLLGLEQRQVIDIFNNAKIFGEITEKELKNSDGTQA